MPAGLLSIWNASTSTDANPSCASRCASAGCSRRGAWVSRYSVSRRCSNRDPRNGRSASATPIRSSGLHAAPGNWAVVTALKTAPCASSMARNAESAPADSRRVARLVSMQAPRVLGERFCRSTAALVQATSSPPARPVQLCVTSTSEAAWSTWLTGRNDDIS